MSKLVSTKFIVTLVGMGCVQASMMLGLIEAPLYATLLAGLVGGYMAIDYASKEAGL